jgi:hypothetical protein
LPHPPFLMDIIQNKNMACHQHEGAFSQLPVDPGSAGLMHPCPIRLNQAPAGLMHHTKSMMQNSLTSKSIYDNL